MSKNLKRNLAILQRYYPTLQKKYHVQRIGIFGSLARGEARRGSDIDILVELNKPIGLFKFFDLERYLHKVLRCPVDVVTKPALKPAIRREVLKEIYYA